MSVRRHQRRPATPTPTPSSPAPPPGHSLGAYIPVEDVAPLFQCCGCSGTPLKTPAARCRDAGHLVCADCLHRTDHVTGSAGDVASCPSCGSALAGPGCDDALECAVRDLPAAACARLKAAHHSHHGHGHGARRHASETSIEPALMLDVDKLEEARRLAESADSFVTSGRVTYSPVACPFPCGRLLTGSGLFPHFEFQHPHVPVAEINLGHPHPLHLDHRHLPPPQESGGRRCQSLFLVHLDASGPLPQPQPQPHATSRGGRGRPVLLRTTRSCHSMLVGRLFVAALQTGRLHYQAHDDADGAAMMAVWASALYDLPAVTCTLTATTANGDAPPRSVSFTGPVSSMRASQRPYDVFARGECLLVPPALMHTMPLALTVAFHTTHSTPMLNPPPPV